MAEEKTPPFTKGKTPTFTEGKKQLEKADVKWNRITFGENSLYVIGVLKEKIYPFSKYTNFPHT